MHADDIAGNIQNPHMGKVFNSYNGPDVYHGLPKVLAPLARIHSYTSSCTSHVLAMYWRMYFIAMMCLWVNSIRLMIC